MPKALVVTHETARLLLAVSASYLDAELRAGRLRGWKQRWYAKNPITGQLWRRARWMIPLSELERWIESKRESYERASEAERARRRIQFLAEHRPYRAEYMRGYRERNGRQSRAKNARPGDIAPRRGPNQPRTTSPEATAEPRGNDAQR